MTSTLHSFPGDVLPDLCDRCDLDPCVCDYIESLRPGGSNALLRDVAAAQMTEPLPHRAACPCPPCYAERMATFIPRMREMPGRCPHGYAPEQVDHQCNERPAS